MDLPREFTPEAVAELSQDFESPYRAQLTSREPYRSLLRANPWLSVPKRDEPLRWGEGRYYDTTVARKHSYWKTVALPLPTKDLGQLREDFYRWGYCLIEDGTSPQQTTALQERVSDQAAAERALEIAYLTEAQQHVWSLVNKGDLFVACMAHETEAVQAGALIEQLLDEALGPDWSHLSFIANISFPGCHPQGIHQDQGLASPCFTPGAPFLVNTIYILQDVNEVNGGTLIIPGSHHLYEKGQGTFGEVPPAINLEAPAGTVMLMDGRVLHGGAVNHSEDLRYIITNSAVRPFIRQQESFHLTVRPEVLCNASEKFLWRCGFQATATRSMVEGYGYFGSGKMGDPNGALVNARLAMDEGSYERIGPLSLQNLEGQAPSLQALQRTHEPARKTAKKTLQRYFRKAP